MFVYYNFSNRVTQLINRERNLRGLDSLEIDSQLRQAAAKHNVDMVKNDFFSHSSYNGTSPFQRMKNAGYRYGWAGENLAAGFTSPKAVVDRWMRSAGHRANILNPNFTEIGVHHKFEANDPGNLNYSHYWTANFATPLDF